MNPNFLDFEQPIAELDAKIQELRLASHGQAFNIEDEISTPLNDSGGGSPPPVGAVYSHDSRASQSPAKPWF